MKRADDDNVHIRMCASCGDLAFKLEDYVYLLRKFCEDRKLTHVTFFVAIDVFFNMVMNTAKNIDKAEYDEDGEKND